MYKCSTCKETKSLDLFFNNKAMKDGKDGMCKPCRQARTRRYLRENPDKSLEYTRRATAKRRGIDPADYHPRKYVRKDTPEY